MSTSAGYILCLVLFCGGAELLVHVVGVPPGGAYAHHQGAGAGRLDERPCGGENARPQSFFLTPRLGNQNLGDYFPGQISMGQRGPYLIGPVGALIAEWGLGYGPIQGCPIAWGLVCTAFLLLPALFLVPVAGKKRD